jgi:GTP-binding protein
MGFGRKETMSTRDYEEENQRKLMPFTDVPILFVSTSNKTVGS